MNILLLASHAVAEYDDLRMFTDLGYDCFAPGGYEVPSRSGEGIRPPLPDAPHHPDLVERLHQVRSERGEPGPAIDWGKAALHDDIIDWADVIICHHFPEQWIGAQWGRIRHKRVIWRTCGQSDPRLERVMTGYRALGLQIVRYSPRERVAFGDDFAGYDAVIRFGKYPDDYGPWTGTSEAVANLTQDMKARGDSCGLTFWEHATHGLPVKPAGKGSEELGGVGVLTYPQMLDYLSDAAVYLYTGTRPASYTLGLIEAMLSGTPVLTIGPNRWGGGWGGEALFEAHEITRSHCADDPAEAHRILRRVVYDEYIGLREWSNKMRERAVELFGIETIGAQWKAFLS